MVINYGIESANVQFVEYCGGEILELVSHVRAYGHYRVNIIYPTMEDKEMRKIIGRSDIIYCSNLPNGSDRKVIYDQFGNLFNVANPSNKIFDMKNITKCDYVDVELTKEKDDIMNNICMSNIKRSSRHASREFNKYHFIADRESKLIRTFLEK
jgi:hypothetical protein